MKLGIVGLPNVGKSTLFNSLTQAGAETENYAFCTIDPNIGVVNVPDSRLEVLKKIYNSEKILPATIEFVDIAGLVKGASKGEGRGNKFLSNIKEVDAILHVVRCFEDDVILHVDGSVNPIRDIETINLELILADLDIIDKRYNRVSRLLKNDKTYEKEFSTLDKIKKVLDNEQFAREANLDEDEIIIVEGFNLLTYKKVLYATNVSEDDVADDGENNPHVQKVKEYAEKEGSETFAICAKIEDEIAELDESDKKEFLADLGILESGLDRLIRASYKLLGLISYMTAGPQEIRAWTIVNGTKAPQAAGKIHTDFERGFIKAEIVSYEALIENGNYNLTKEKGLVRIEGKEYIVKDNDIILFRFNV